jgi:hypothetical protein
MKVLQVNTVCGTGSTGRIAADIHKMLIHQGHESIVAYGRETAHNCDNTIKIGNNLDFYTHALKTRILDKLRNKKVSSLKIKRRNGGKIGSENRDRFIMCNSW